MATNDLTRLSPDVVREHQIQGDALLVCAYEDAEKCDRVALEGSIKLDDLEALMPTNRVVVFYCA